MPGDACEVASQFDHTITIRLGDHGPATNTAKRGCHRSGARAKVTTGQAAAGETIERSALDAYPAGKVCKRAVRVVVLKWGIHTSNHSEVVKISQAAWDISVDNRTAGQKRPALDRNEQNMTTQ